MTQPLPLEPLLEAAKPWLSRPNVVGIGIGPKVTGGRETGEQAVLVFVERKQAAAAADFLVPPTLAAAGAEPVPTDVQETGPNRLEVLNQRVRPVPGGYQISAENMPGTGTLGVSIVWGGKYRSITNNHVIAKNGNEKAPVYEPDKSADNAIGTVDGMTPVVTYPTSTQPSPVYNRQDLAWSYTNQSIASPDIHLIGRPTGIRAAVAGEQVKLIGKQTAKVQTARIADVRTLAVVEWARGTSRPWAYFEQLVRLDRVCTQPGDSGTAYVATSDMKVVAIHVGANQAYSWGCQL
jgi:hypothetical protein